MIYGGTISTDANTTAAAPKKTEVAVTEGIVHHLTVVFPPGPAGLLHVQIFDGQYQMYPTTHGQSFVGDNLKLDLDVMYAKEDFPFVFTIVTWNLDDTYAHDVTVLLSFESSEAFKARYMPTVQTDAMLAALGSQEAVKSAARRERLAAFVEELPGEETESNGNDVA